MPILFVFVVPNMETSSVIATWTGTLITAVGLGSLVAQSSAIQEHLDPFYSIRGADHLGSWTKKQPKLPWYAVSRRPPLGPLLTASLTTGFCGYNIVHLSRKPTNTTTEVVGKATWTVILAVFHKIPEPLFQSLALVDNDSNNFDYNYNNDNDIGIEQPRNTISQVVTTNHEAKILKSQWDDALPLHELTRYKATACAAISRRTLIVLLALSNARAIFKHSGAAGFRAAFAGYNGLWIIEWPIGNPAVVHFSGHDSHGAGIDVYPPSFPRRVDKCINMLAGIVDGKGIKVGFPGRKDHSVWELVFCPRGFAGSHGSRHLYNMMSGKVHEVDLLLLREAGNTTSVPQKTGTSISVPSLQKGFTSTIYIREFEKGVLAHALDSLPWSPLSWSMHRGMKDILLSYGLEIMNKHRLALAECLKNLAETNGRDSELQKRGWNREFVKNSMPDMVYAAVMSGTGNSGDLVRVLTDIALLSWHQAEEELDETHFWRGRLKKRYTCITSTSDYNNNTKCYEYESDEAPTPNDLTPDTIVALVKYVVLEWSQELDYQMYHDLPMELLVS